MHLAFRGKMFLTAGVVALCLMEDGGRPAQAATVWQSPILTNATWSKAGSPHWLLAHPSSPNVFLITNDVTVTIEAGATVIATNGSMLITVMGQILANGTAEDPIYFGGNGNALRTGGMVLQSPLTSEFHYCHFAYWGEAAVGGTGGGIGFAETAPQGRHLFEYCIFREFSGNVLGLFFYSGVPFRVLHCVFAKYGNYALYFGSAALTDETEPTIWYNAFEGNGIYLSYPYDCGNRDFFRFNRVASGTGIKIEGNVSRVRISDNDLVSCAPSIEIGDAAWVNTTNLTVNNCSLNTIVNVGGYADTATLANNWWGTTNLSTIVANVFGGAITPSMVQPFLTSNNFPQADVDGSSGGDATTPADAAIVKSSLIGLTNLTPSQAATADVDRDGTVTVRDALMIESYVNGLIWKLPAP